MDVRKADVKNLSREIPAGSIDAIITEPFLGKPMRGNERPETVRAIVDELQELYLQAFGEFKKVLKKSGRLVMVIPEWHIKGEIFKLRLDGLEKAGWQRINGGDLMYKREDQKVWRNICIFER